MTTTSENSTMIAVFADRDRANQSIDNLRHAGYSYDQIRLVDNGSNSFMQDLKSLFTGQTTAMANSPDDWMRIGVPEQDARNYQNELNAGRSIVLLKALGSPEQALSILHQSGAYDIAFRLRTAQPNLMQGAYNPNAQQGTYNPNAQQQEAYNPNAQPVVSNPNAQQGTYETWPQQSSANPLDERKA